MGALGLLACEGNDLDGSGGSATTATGGGSSTSSSATAGSTTFVSAGAGGADLAWGCLGEVTWAPPERMIQTITVRFVNEYTGGGSVIGAQVKACSRDDAPCAMPLDTQTTDANGYVTLDVSTDLTEKGEWDGYFDIQADGYPTNLVVMVKPTSSAQFIEPLALIDQTVLDGGVQLITGAGPESDKGHVAVRLFDCQDAPAAGVQIAVEPADVATAGYFGDSLLPVEGLTETGPNGIAALANVTPGSPTVTATRVGGDWIGSTRVPVRAGAITTFGLPPTPLP